MLLPRPGDLYIHKDDKYEVVVDSIETVSYGAVMREERVVFHVRDHVIVAQRMSAESFESEFEFVRSS